MTLPVPVEVLVGRGGQVGRPDEQLETEDHRGKQPGSKGSENSSENGDGGEQKKCSCCRDPEPLAGRDPRRHIAHGPGKGNNVHQPKLGQTL